MKLQLALDIDKKKALSLCKKINKHIDIIEIGTPLVKAEGLDVVKEFKEFRKPIVADLKTMDTGFLEAEMAFKAGADISSVCGTADDSTIQGAVKVARRRGKEILVDLIAVKNVVKRTKEIMKLGVDYIGVHTGIDMQGKESVLVNLKKVSKIVGGKVKVVVAGGINIKNIGKIIEYDVDVVVVGSAITKAKNPLKVAKVLKEVVENE